MTASVRDHPDEHRYVALVDDHRAGFAAYRLEGDTLVLTHTEVDDSYEGQGIGSLLARAALDGAREAGQSVRPECPFVAGWIKSHPDYVELVPEDRRASYGL